MNPLLMGDGEMTPTSESSNPLRLIANRGIEPFSARSSCEQLFHLAAIASLASLVAACGGNPGNSSSPPPAPPPQPLAAQLSVPEPIGYDTDHLAAFNRLNEVRLAAGLGMLFQSVKLDQAAQAHTDWSIENNLFSHVESPDTPGYTGVNWTDRDAAAGYLVASGTEVIATGAAPAAAIDGLINMAYHRAGLFMFEPLDVGIGYSQQGVEGFNGMLVADLAFPGDGGSRSDGQLPQVGIDGVVIWPLDGAQGVVAHMGNEVPNPVPGVDVLSLGTPVSIEVASSERLTVSRFQLFDDDSGKSIPTVLLTHDSDPNQILASSDADLIPIGSLPFDKTFRAEFVGAAESTSTSSRRSISRVWRFRTGEVDFPPDGY
jgi:uncharacterized protein YkwD